jgi:hypothetical protein
MATNDQPDQSFIDLTEFRQEEHVQLAFQTAWTISDGQPINAHTALLAAVMLGRSTGSPAFHKLASILGIEERLPPEPATGFQLQAVPLGPFLGASYSTGERFFRHDGGMWGRDYITFALLANDPSLKEFEEDNSKLAALRDEWYRYVTSDEQHRDIESWTRWWHTAGVPDPDARRATPTDKAYLLTWDADRTPFDNLAGVADRLEQEGSVVMRWSVGHPEVKSGDRAFFMRHGPGEPGLVGLGRIVTDAEEGPHWDPAKTPTERNYYATVLWEQFNEAPIVSLERLIEETGEEGLWTTHGSGLTVARTLAESVEGLMTAARSGAGAAVRPVDRADYHPDDPAEIDALNREDFAEALGLMLRQAPADRRSYVLHLHGRWGSGKSTILGFLRKRLEAAGGSGDDQPWLVADFNAWQQQHAGQAALALKNVLYSAIKDSEPGFFTKARFKVWWNEFWWRFFIGPAKWFAGILVAGLLVGALLHFFGSDGDQLSTAKTVVTLLSSLVGLVTLLLTFGHQALLGSSQVAQKTLQLSQDPMKSLSKHFKNLVRSTDRPVAIFIDDLDRCEAEYVIELLRAVQTLYGEAPAAYVVAADRDWVRASYEKIYRDYGQISEAGRPLGHLFLEKLFQFSVGLPQLSDQTRAAYLQRLTAQQAAPAAPEAEEEIRELELQFAEKTDDYIQKRVREAPPSQEGKVQKAASRVLLSKERMEERESKLRGYAHLFDPNPRSIKRLVNAYSLKVAVKSFHRGIEIDQDKLVRWTILEMRWPLLAEHLAERPNDILHLRAHDPPNVPEPIAQLLAREDVADVVSTKVDNGRRLLLEPDDIREALQLPAAV